MANIVLISISDSRKSIYSYSVIYCILYYIHKNERMNYCSIKRHLELFISSQAPYIFYIAHDNITSQTHEINYVIEV